MAGTVATAIHSAGSFTRLLSPPRPTGCRAERRRSTGRARRRLPNTWPLYTGLVSTPRTAERCQLLWPQAETMPRQRLRRAHKFESTFPAAPGLVCPEREVAGGGEGGL